VRLWAVPSNLRREPLFDVDPRTGATIEVFYVDRTMETFGRSGAGWFWCSRRRGFASEGPPTGPFATRYAAYRHGLNGGDLVPLNSARPASTRNTCAARTKQDELPVIGDHTSPLWNLSGTF
jgi:hypothetical protein